MITNEKRATNFTESVFCGYMLGSLLDKGPRKFSWSTGSANPFTKQHVDLIIEKFSKKGINAVVKTRGRIKSYPSTSLTLEFSK